MKLTQLLWTTLLSHHMRYAVEGFTLPPAPATSAAPSKSPQLPLGASTEVNNTSATNPYECQRLPIGIETWKRLDIDNTLKNLGGSKNLTLSRYASMNQAGNFVCGIGETCNVGQLCHPVKAPAWQVLYAAQEYNNYMNAMVDSVNYAMSQVQSISASMVNDLFEDITDSRFVINLKYIFDDLYRGIAYGAVALFVVTWIGFTFFNALLAITDILALTAFGAGLAAWIQGTPKTISFQPWSELSYYITQAQQSLTAHITQEMQDSLNRGLTAPNGVADILKGGAFFQPPSLDGMMETMEKNTVRIFQSRLLARMLRQQNAFVTVSVDDCKGSGPNGARSGPDVLSYCDPEQKLLYNVVRAHKKKTINTIYNAAVIINKYNFTAEYIVKTSWDCQKKYGKFEHDAFENMNGTLSTEVINTDCMINLPVCDTRNEAVRALKLGKHKTTVVACRKGAGLPI